MTTLPQCTASLPMCSTIMVLGEDYRGFSCFVFSRSKDLRPCSVCMLGAWSSIWYSPWLYLWYLLGPSQLLLNLYDHQTKCRKLTLRFSSDCDLTVDNVLSLYMKWIEVATQIVIQAAHSDFDCDFWNKIELLLSSKYNIVYDCNCEVCFGC